MLLILVVSLCCTYYLNIPYIVFFGKASTPKVLQTFATAKLLLFLGLCKEKIKKMNFVYSKMTKPASLFKSFAEELAPSTLLCIVNLRIHSVQERNWLSLRSYNPYSLPRASCTKQIGKNAQACLDIFTYSFCGKRGIRTPGASRLAGFQDRCNRPLYHLSESGCKITAFF